MTAHDAFGYLADAYGMNFLASLTLKQSRQRKRLAQLIAQLKEDGAAALFVENIATHPCTTNLQMKLV